MTGASQFELDFENLMASLPRGASLEQCSLPDGKRTAFVGILGFERRCYAAPAALVTRGWRADKAFAVHYDHEAMRAANQRHKEDFDKAMRALDAGGEPVPLGHSDHELARDFGDSLLSALLDHGFDVDSPGTHVVFDITVGSSRLLLEGLHALFGTEVTISLVYSEAAEYRPSFQEYQVLLEKNGALQAPPPEFLTVGVDRIELLRRIPGRSADARPLFLVLFPAFAPTRASAVLEELSPSRVQWLFGVPHLVRNRWRLDAQRHYHRQLIERSHRGCYVSTFDYRETLEVLESIYRRRRAGYAVLICSLGSKLQKVGQVLFHLLRPEVGTVVAVPRVWDPERYSGEEPLRVHAIPFGPARPLREMLWRTRTLRL